jgi:hypothetical protein
MPHAHPEWQMTANPAMPMVYSPPPRLGDSVTAKCVYASGTKTFVAR